MKKCTFALRPMLALGIAVSILSNATSLVRAAETDSGGYEVIANAFGFGVDIPGCADASRNIREISIDELRIDSREMTTGLDVEYRLYGPGQAHWGSAKFTSAVTLGGSKELQIWWQEAAKGKNIRKNITVTLYKSDKTPGRSYTLHECFPTKWSSVEFDPVFQGPTESVTVEIGWIEFAATGATETSNDVSATSGEVVVSDQDAKVRGFKVEIGAAGHRADVDTAWESVSGGELIVELTETTIGSDKFQTTSPGHKSVGEITLRGAMTDGRKALCQWINDTVSGRTWKRTLAITELLSVDGGVKDGKVYSLVSAYPIRYRFPVLSVNNTKGNAEEEIECRVVREESELPPRCLGLIDIPEAPVASRSALALGLQDLNLDVARVELTGTASEPNATIVVRGGAGRELMAWYQEVSSGKDIRKNITVTLFKNGKPAGQFNLLDCFPVSYEAGEPDGTSTVQTETLTVKIGRIEFKT